MSIDSMHREIEIRSERYVMRSLTVHDVGDRYVAWMQDSDTRRFIAAAERTQKLADLRDYVQAHSGKADVLFLGIFERADGRHIGNIKYEPVNSEQGYAIVGILIGEPDARGKGVTGEVILASAQWLKAHRGITQILLGVSKDNLAAIRAYERVGFVVGTTPHIPPSPGALTMVWNV